MSYKPVISYFVPILIRMKLQILHSVTLDTTMEQKKRYWEGTSLGTCPLKYQYPSSYSMSQ